MTNHTLPLTPKGSRLIVPAVVASVALALVGNTSAITSNFIYTTPVPATVDYQTPANWDNGVPKLIDDSALFSSNIDAGTLTVNLNGPVVLGNLTLGDSNAATNGFYTIANGAGGSLTFDVTTGNASLQKTVGTGSSDTISATVTLNDTLAADIRSSGTISVTGAIGGTGGLIRSGSVSGTPTAVTGGVLALTNNANSYIGSTVLESGVLQATLNGDIAPGANSVLGNSATPIVIGSSGFTPTVTGANAQTLRLTAGSDAANYTISRAIDFSGVIQASAGQSTLSFQGDGTGGVNTNTLTIASTVSLGARSSVVNVQALRAGQVINFTGDITGTGTTITTGVLFGTAGGIPNVDGRASGTFRFSNLARNYTNSNVLNQGTILIDGVVGAVGTASPIGQSAINLANGGGSGNIVGNANFSGQTGLNDSSIDTIRSVFLDSAGSSYARILAPGGGNSSLPAGGSYGTNVNVINGFQFGGLNTSGTTTFSGNITPGSPLVGAAPNNPITVAINMALSSAGGGSTLFSGVISDGTTTNANTVSRVTINQFRNNPSLDGTTGVAATAGSDGNPDPATANMLVGTAKTGTVILTGANTYEGGTEVLGGTLLVNNSTGSSGTGLGVVTVTSPTAILGGTGFVGGVAGATTPVTNNGIIAPGDPLVAGGIGTLTIGSAGVNRNTVFGAGSAFNIQVSGANSDLLATFGGLDLSSTTDTLNITGTLTAPSYTIATYNSGGLTGTFNTVTGNGIYTVNYTPTAIILSVPEPSTYALMVGGAGMLFLVQRRRRQS